MSRPPGRPPVQSHQPSGQRTSPVSRPILVATGMAVHRAHARLAGQPAMDRRAGLRASQVAQADDCEQYEPSGFLRSHGDA